MVVHSASRIPCESVARGTSRGGQSSVSEPGPNSKMGVLGVMTIIDCSPRGELEWGQRQVANATRPAVRRAGARGCHFQKVDGWRWLGVRKQQADEEQDKGV